MVRRRRGRQCSRLRSSCPLALVAVVVLASALPGARGQETGVVPSADALDVSDLMGLGGGAGGIATTDVDAQLDPGERRKRMSSCVRGAQTWLEKHADEAETQVASLMTQAQAAGPAGEFTAEQATNQLVFSLTMTCYQKIDKEFVEQIHTGTKLSADAEKHIFELAAAPPRPTRKQFQLLESVMKEEQLRMAQEVDPAMEAGGIGIIGRGMSGRAQALYLLLVLALFGGLAAYAFPKVLNPPREKARTEKMVRKLAKAEMRLDKKKHG